jgi:TPR repeat protein
MRVDANEIAIMRRLVLALALAVSLAMPGAARADFAAGVAAYDKGDYDSALKEWLPLAEEGDPAAQRNLGHMYRKGLGVPKDLAKAAEWYERAAESGFARAQANLASLYLRGDGVSQDYYEAAKWFDRAARQGHAIAQFNLGLMYERGLGVPRSKEKAFGWYYQAARAGHTRAAEKLAGLVSSSPGPGGAPPLPGPPSTTEAAKEPLPAATQPTATLPSTQSATTEPVPSPSAPSPAVTEPTAPPKPAPAVTVKAEPSPPTAPPPQPAQPSESEAAAAVVSRESGEEADEEPDAGAPATETAAVQASEDPSPETADDQETEEPSERSGFLRFIFGYNNELLYPDKPPPQSTDKEPAEPVAEEITSEDDSSSLSPDDEDTEEAPLADDEDDTSSLSTESDAAGTALAMTANQDPASQPDRPAAQISETSTSDAVEMTDREGDEQEFSLADWLRAAGDQKTLKLAGAPASAEQPVTNPPVVAEPARAAAATPMTQPLDESKAPVPGVVPSPRAAPLDPARLREGQAAYDAGNYASALESWRALAEKDDPEAQFLIGSMHFDGVGTKPDPEQAYVWWSLAANRDHIKAAKSLRRLIRDMTPEQVAVAEFLVEEQQDRR